MLLLIIKSSPVFDVIVQSLQSLLDLLLLVLQFVTHHRPSLQVVQHLLLQSLARWEQDICCSFGKQHILRVTMYYSCRRNGVNLFH